MSYSDYLISRDLATLSAPFYALIMTAMRQADTENMARLRLAWPDVADELEARYHAPGGLLGAEQGDMAAELALPAVPRDRPGAA
jgi:hypothetical protein